MMSRPSWSVCWMERREKVETQPMSAMGWCSLRAVLGSALLERDFL